MPSKYKRISNRNSWSEESMAGAISEVLDGTMGFQKAAKLYGVPKTTLERKVNKAKMNKFSPQVAAAKKLGRYETVFTLDQEKDLVEHVLHLEERLFGITLTDLRILAYDLAVKNNITHSFNNDKKMAGKGWLYSFLTRNPRLSLRNPEATSMARAKGFNRIAVEKFFDLLASLIEKYRFTPNNIYNVDETGILTVPNKPSKVLSLRGKKQVGSLTSAERGDLVTVEMCISAAGVYVPPMFVFPRVKENPRLMDDAPPGSSAAYHKSGWINKDTFIIWFKKFLEFSNPSQEKPVLLLLDGHKSHTKSLELINLARKMNVIILTFPPHTTHRLQPLDVTAMAPLSAYYEQEVRKWLFTHPGRCVSIYEVAKLFNAAFSRAAVMETAIKGFRKTGICPFNPDIFPDHLFAPSFTTDQPIPADQSIMDLQHSCNTAVPASVNKTTIPGAFLQPKPNGSGLTQNPAPSIQATIADQPTTSSGDKGLGLTYYRPSLPFSISPKVLLPAPSVGLERPNAEKKSDKRKGKTAVITSSPYKFELESEENEKKEKIKEKLEKMKARIAKKNMVLIKSSKANQIKRKRIVKNLEFPVMEPKVTQQEEENRKMKKNIVFPVMKPKLTHRGEDNPKKIKTVFHKPTCKPTTQEWISSSSDDDSEREEACIFCNALHQYKKAGEGWIQCSGCQGWAHEACSKAEEEDDSFVCDFCAIAK